MANETVAAAAREDRRQRVGTPASPRRSLRAPPHRPAGRGGVLWPFGTALALAVVPLLWILFAGAAFVGNRWLDWPTRSAATPLLYIIAAVGLAPVWLLLFDALAARGAVVSTKWFSLDFSGSALAGRAAQLSPDLGGVAGEPIHDSSAAAIHETLNQAGHQKVVLIDLGSGESWWLTRVLAVCSGAIEAGAPEVIVFVGREVSPNHVEERAFLGWIHPHDGVRAIREKRPALKEIHDRALAVGRLAAEGAAGGAMPAAPAAPASYFATRPDVMALGEDATLRVLLEMLGQQEQQQVPVGGERLDTANLYSIFGEYLYRDAVDEDQPPEEVLRRFFEATAAYVAVVSGRRFDRLVDSRAVERSLLGQLVLEQPAATVVATDSGASAGRQP